MAQVPGMVRGPASREQRPAEKQSPMAQAQLAASLNDWQKPGPVAPAQLTAPVNVAVQAVHGKLLQRFALVDEQLAGVKERTLRHDQALRELAASQLRVEAALQQRFHETSEATAALATSIEQRTAHMIRADGLQQDQIQSLEARVAQLKSSAALFASEAQEEMARQKADGCEKQRQELEQAVSELRGELQKALESEQYGMARHNDVLESNERHRLELEQLVSSLRTEMHQTFQATAAQLVSMDTAYSTSRLRAMAEIHGKVDVLGREVSNAMSQTEQVRASFLQYVKQQGAAAGGRPCDDFEGLRLGQWWRTAGAAGMDMIKKEPKGRTRRMRSSSSSSRSSTTTLPPLGIETTQV